MLCVKYMPTTQKRLFHKDVVSHIRKWLKNIDDLSEYKKPVKHILFLYGPIGCGKTVTADVLFKQYNVNSIDPDDIRSAEKINDITHGIPGFTSMTLTNIDRWNQSGIKEKHNLVVVDNIELCEKNILNFVDTIHNKRNVNVPIILLCNNPKLKDTFVLRDNCTFLEFKKPSLLELTKLINEINVEEVLEMSKGNCKSLIESSQSDVRQLLLWLEQWKASNGAFSDFLSSMQTKHVDVDLNNKLTYLMDSTQPFEFDPTFILASSEPVTISSAFHQNYINALQSHGVDDLTALEAASSILDNLSSSSTTHSFIFNEQMWDLYDSYAVESCVAPSFVMKRASDDKTQLSVFKSFEPVKTMSYNYINSFNEVRSTCVQNTIGNRLIHKENRAHIVSADVDTCFHFAKIILSDITTLHAYFESNKRGKNTSKQEKLDICDSIKDGAVKCALESLVNKIYSYNLFEVDLDDIIVNKHQYTNEVYLKANVNKIDLRVVKRFINIFSFQDCNKALKSHVEMSLKYKLLQKLLEDVAKTTETSKITLDSLVEDLSNIWNI